MGTDYNVSELLERGKRLTGYKDIRTELLKQYRADTVISPDLHKYFVGRAARIARQCIDGGGSQDEVKTVLIYLMLCVDAKKYKFNAQQYYTDHIAVLDRKYQLTRVVNK